MLRRSWSKFVILACVMSVFCAVLQAGPPNPRNQVADGTQPKRTRALTDASTIISNGTVQLGVFREAHLNAPGGTPSSGQGVTNVGIRFVPTNADATAPGCLCEGWGAADAISRVTGHANEALGGPVNITPVSFNFTATTAVSVVDIGPPGSPATLRVTHDYHPSPATPNAYEVTVTIRNISSAPVQPLYRRVMDWDVEPTAFSEFVTARIGNAAALLANNNNGFATADPLGSRTSGLSSSLIRTGNFTDEGPADHGGLFDFGFPQINPGQETTFEIYYGAAASQAQALTALAAVNAEVFSLGKPSGPGGRDTGVPNSFFFAFAGVGGTPIATPGPTPLPAGNLDVAAGAEHSLSLGSGGSVCAWGYNRYGQLGDGTRTDRRLPVTIAELSGITQVDAGFYHSLALAGDRTVFAWGSNFHGQIGNNSNLDQLRPVRVAGLTGVTAISAGGGHNLALKSDGTVWAWGNNTFGQLGDGSRVSRRRPVRVAKLSGIRAIAAGADFSLALTNDGRVWSWGNNRYGQLGNNSQRNVNRLLPAPVAGLSDIRTIAAGYTHALAIRTDGRIIAWGNNTYGQLGNGQVGTFSIRPVLVAGITNAVAIAGGANHSLAARSNGVVLAWGLNQSGQLGDGTFQSRRIAVVVNGVPGVTAVNGLDAGADHSIAGSSNGTVHDWGFNKFGQLGDGTRVTRSRPVDTGCGSAGPAPTPVPTTVPTPVPTASGCGIPGSYTGSFSAPATGGAVLPFTSLIISDTGAITGEATVPGLGTLHITGTINLTTGAIIEAHVVEQPTTSFTGTFTVAGSTVTGTGDVIDDADGGADIGDFTASRSCAEPTPVPTTVPTPVPTPGGSPFAGTSYVGSYSGAELGNFDLHVPPAGTSAALSLFSPSEGLLTGSGTLTPTGTDTATVNITAITPPAGGLSRSNKGIAVRATATFTATLTRTTGGTFTITGITIVLEGTSLTGTGVPAPTSNPFEGAYTVSVTAPGGSGSASFTIEGNGEINNLSGSGTIGPFPFSFTGSGQLNPANGRLTLVSRPDQNSIGSTLVLGNATVTRSGTTLSVTGELFRDGVSQGTFSGSATATSAARRGSGNRQSTVPSARVPARLVSAAPEGIGTKLVSLAQSCVNAVVGLVG